jgi:hypothetical protein
VSLQRSEVVEALAAQALRLLIRAHHDPAIAEGSGATCSKRTVAWARRAVSAAMAATASAHGDRSTATRILLVVIPGLYLFLTLGLVTPQITRGPSAAW